MKKKLALALMLSAAVFSQAAEEKPEVVFKINCKMVG